MRIHRKNLGDQQYRLKLFQGDTEVANVRYELINDEEIYVAYLGVKKRFQRRGFGSYLLGKLLESIIKKHPRIKYLQAWPISKGSLRLCDRVFGKRYRLKGCERNLPQDAPKCRYNAVTGIRHVKVWYRI